mmetsp:Transcript_25169/g.45886  ORF Transcript_25169/g.45886 Transcript_25169/m.45886 type:complete len:96 (-) Transcript_25169:86-373(-)
MRRSSRQGPLFIALFERLLSVAMVKGGVVINKASKQTTRFTINQAGARQEFEVTRNKEKTGIGRERRGRKETRWAARIHFICPPIAAERGVEGKY